MDVVDRKATGQNIKHRIRENNLTYKQVAKACHFSTDQAIYKWLRGDGLPSIDSLVILANLFHCRLDEIIVTQPTIKEVTEEP